MRLQDGVGHLFIHAVGAAGHPAAHIGQPGQLQQTLQGAVLAVHAVQYRENQIHPPRLPAIGFLYHQPVVGGHGGKQAGNAGIALLPAAIGDERKLPGVEEPLPGAGDADRQELVFIAV